MLGEGGMVAPFQKPLETFWKIIQYQVELSLIYPLKSFMFLEYTIETLMACQEISTRILRLALLTAAETGSSLAIP